VIQTEIVNLGLFVAQTIVDISIKEQRELQIVARKKKKKVATRGKRIGIVVHRQTSVELVEEIVIQTVIVRKGLFVDPIIVKLTTKERIELQIAAQKNQMGTANVALHSVAEPE